MQKRERDRRDLEIVKLLNTGRYSLEEVGNNYGITRQAVSLLYFKRTGMRFVRIKKEFANQKNEKRQKLKIKQKQLLDNTVKYRCSVCRTRVRYKDARISLCPECHRLVEEEHRSLKRKVRCWGCGIRFYPYVSSFYSKRKRLGRSFHNKECYLANQSKGRVKYV